MNTKRRQCFEFLAPVPAGFNCAKMKILLTTLSFLILASVQVRAQDGAGSDSTLEAGAHSLGQNFASPPQEYGPWVYWWWTNGWIDEEGIRKDLDHMKSVGISGALVFQSGGVTRTPFNVPFLSERWIELFMYAVEQAAERSIAIGLNLCDGWTSGGEWITPELQLRPSPNERRKDDYFTGAYSNGAKPERELDPLNPKAMDVHFENTIGRILEKAGDEWRRKYVGTTFQTTHTDSWERPDPWTTPNFATEFETRRGYAWSSPNNERGKEDFNLTRAEMWAENYYGRLSTLSHEVKLQTHCEAAGPSHPGLRDSLMNYGYNDIVMTEFWARGGRKLIAYVKRAGYDDLKTASSAAHIYGKKIVQAEAYTSVGRADSFNFTTALSDLINVGNRAFCFGVNRNVLHMMNAQAGNAKAPGFCHKPWVGFEFTRLNSIWPLGKAWVDYLRRCQYLLQQGTTVCDFLYFHGNQMPVNMPAKWALKPAKPEGTDADLLNNDALMTRASVADNRITFPGGHSYKYLVLRSDTSSALTPATLSKLLELVKDGATLIGRPPKRSFGLMGYPESDKEFERLKSELWPSSNKVTVIGKGRVIQNTSLTDVMNMDGLAPDLRIEEDEKTAALPESTMGGLPSPGFEYIHRTIGGMEVYFVANLRSAPASGTFTFRTTGKQPQIWNPIDGSTWKMPKHEVLNGTTKVFLHFEQCQSYFVVFNSPQNANETYHNNDLAVNGQLQGPWNVSFDPKWGGPESVDFENLMDWTQHTDNGIKYYSGTATYTKTFDLPESLKGTKSAVYLDLGNVQDLAEITLNGQKLGARWCRPYRCDITRAMKDTGNLLQIAVVNRFSNRLLGDKVLKEQYCSGSSSHGKQLIPAGLLGPVRIMGVAEK